MIKGHIKWLGALLSAVSLNCAAAYPERPVSMVVGYSAGGTTDILARILAEELSNKLGQPVVIENKPGAGANIAAAYVEKAKPDGYTLFLGTIAQVINPVLYKNSVNPIKAFEPISSTASIPLVLVVNNQVPANDIASFVSYAKANPGKMNYSSSGNGSPGHLAAELFKGMGGIDAMHIPYKGGALGNTAVISGDVQFSFATMPGSAPLIEGNKLKALGVTTKERSAKMPELAPISDNPGFENFETNTWNAVFAPKGTPPEVINRLNQSLVEILKSDKIKEIFLSHGAIAKSSSPEELNKFLEEELQRWGTVIKQANLQIE